MTVFLDSHNIAAVQESVETLRTWQRSQKGLHVALVYGPVSAEDQLYAAKCPPEQMSVTALSEALTEIGARFQILDPCEPQFVQELASYQVALSNLHGPFGEDGRLQGLLDYLRMPYCGSGVAASAVAADKIRCKRFMESLGIPTPLWHVWSANPVEWLGWPVMVKPTLGGSSVGMSLVHNPEELAAALGDAARVDASPVLVEEYLPGTPVTVGMLELPNGVLVFPPLATNVHSGEFYDAEAKLDADSVGTVSVTKAGLTGDLLSAVTGYAKTLWDGLDCHGAARVDFIVTDREAYALEVNTTPGMSRDSNFVVGAALHGLTHTDVVVAMLHEAMARAPYDVPLPRPVFTGLFSEREATA
ncbi:D-alanine--D-alanine ligase [Streptomyces sannanensis]|uniref:D-alanine--D-alanine ligase n=1 Tax=Streptomyces sannanensis TaxID=285536 RepID=A0ABP6S9A4_9ACTN